MTIGPTSETAATPAPSAAEAPPPASAPAVRHPLIPLDAAWQRMMARPGARRAWTWGGPLVVTLVAAVLRLWNLGHPHALVFDETYYVKDAYTLMNLGYEGSWPENANVEFDAGNPGVFTDSPSFIAHPPLGKWIIAGGLAVFGAEDSVGWRISTAIVGILLVVLTMAVAQRLFRSTLLTVIAGGLLAIDGNAIVMSRVALLDVSVALFVLLGVGAVLLDRSWSQRRIAAWIARREGLGRPTDWGPALWGRPWLIAAGLAFGAASGVKWNGFYFLAIFAVYVVVGDALDRRRAGVAFWATGAVLKQAPVTFVLMVPLAAVVNVASWAGWFATDGGYYRRWIEDGGQRWAGLLAWVPDWFQNWWHYQAAMYGYHVGENTPHAYQANPLTWLFLIRPTSMYYQDLGNGSAEAITGIANPLIWWACTAAIGFCVWRLIRTRDARLGFILVGIAAGLLPWMLYLNRTVFQFYTIAFEPFLVLGLTAVAAWALGGPGERTEERRWFGVFGVGAFLLLAVLLSVFWYPLWTGTPVPIWFMRLHYWLPTWI